jgi:hypothetical protein
MSDACVSLGIPSNVISDVIRSSLKYTAKYGYAIAREEEASSLTQELLDKGLAEYKKQRHDQIYVQDLETGVSHLFEFAADAGELVGVGGIFVSRDAKHCGTLQMGKYKVSYERR